MALEEPRAEARLEPGEAPARRRLEAMLPAASRSERVRFLTGMRKNLPSAAYNQLRTNVSALLPADEWEAIEAA